MPSRCVWSVAKPRLHIGFSPWLLRVGVRPVGEEGIDQGWNALEPARALLRQRGCARASSALINITNSGLVVDCFYLFVFFINNK